MSLPFPILSNWSTIFNPVVAMINVKSWREYTQASRHAQHTKAPFSVALNDMMDVAGQNLLSGAFALKEAGQGRVINWDWCEMVWGRSDSFHG